MLGVQFVSRKTSGKQSEQKRLQSDNTLHVKGGYNVRIFIDILISSIKRLYHSIRMDVIDVVNALV